MTKVVKNKYWWKISFDEYINWQALKQIRNLKFIKSMYIWIFIVPISVKVLEEVGDIAKVTIFNHTFEAQLTLPFSWATFYFSAICFALANIIFQARCPVMVKSNNDYNDFKKSNMGIEHLDYYLYQAKLSWTDLQSMIVGDDNYFVDIHQVRNPKTEDGKLRKRFWVLFEFSNTIRLKSMLLVTTLYFLGFILISIVLIQNVSFVIQYLSK